VADQTESSILIDATPDRVMNVIADLAAYPQWSDGISEVTVLTESQGRPETARFELASGPIKDTYELTYDWVGDSHVSWQLTRGDMLRAMDGSYDLSQSASGQTEVRYRLVVDVKVPMIGMIKRKAEKVIVDTALRGLKARVESLDA
jgi:ribosome-associated toxin RatA of RatAB toxin-antitoxin module